MTPILALLALQVYRGREAVDPATYTSRSGAFELRVEASRIDGTGDGAYRLLRSGVPIWSGDKDFTLLDARVTDDGRVIGYALTEGRRRLGHLRVIVLAPDGAELQDEPHERTGPSDMHGDPEPWLFDLLLLDAADACVFRVHDWRKNQGLESWWVYRMTTGERLAEYLPAERLGHATEPPWRIHGAQALDPQGLVLAYGFGGRRHEDQWFALLEPLGEPVWRLEDPGAFATELGGVSGSGLLERVRRRNPPALPPGADMRIWRVRQGASVDYCVERDSGAEHGWRVAEVGRTPDEGRREPPAEPERIALAHLSSVALARGSGSEEGQLGPVVGWGFDDGGGLCVVRSCNRERFEHLRVDRDGRVLGTTPIEEPPEKLTGRRIWTHVAGQRWLLTISPDGDGASSSAFFADGTTGALRPLAGFKCPAIKAAAPTPEGGFVVLATHHLEFTLIDTVVAFGPDGVERWRLFNPIPSPDDPASLFSPQDLTVMPDGDVVVLDGARDALQVFDAGSAFVASVDLASAWGEEPSYLTLIEPAPGDGLLVYDFNGTTPVRLVERDGTVRARFDRFGRFAPDGQLWTCDGNRFYLLDGAGREIAPVGLTPSAEFLNEAGPSALDALGRICIQDARNGVLHVWSADGGRLLTAVPEPTDFGRVDTRARIVAGPDDGFAGQAREKGHVLFDASGRRTGLLEDVRELDFAPASGVSWAWRAGGVVELRAADGEIRELARLPSGRWITRPEDVCALADGSFVVLADNEVGLFDAGGRPLQSFGLPGTPGHTVSAGSRWILVSSYAREAWLIDREGGTPRLFHAGEVGEKSSCEMALGARGSEVLVLDKQALVLHRYALP